MMKMRSMSDRLGGYNYPSMDWDDSGVQEEPISVPLQDDLQAMLQDELAVEAADRYDAPTWYDLITQIGMGYDFGGYNG